MAHEQHLKSAPSPHPSPRWGEGKGEWDVSFLSFLQKQESRFFCVVPCFLQGQVWIPAFAGMTTIACFGRSVPRKPRAVRGVKGHNIMILHYREAPACGRGAS